MNMHNGTIQKNKNRILSIINVLIAYSSTTLWLLIYNFLFDYLSANGIRCRAGISLGILIHSLVIIIIALSLLISILNKRQLKILINIVYMIYSSLQLLPHYPYRWLYFSIGTCIFLYILDTFLTFLKIKRSFKESIFNYTLLLAMYIFIFILNFVYRQAKIMEMLVFFLKYYAFASFIIVGIMLLYYFIIDSYARNKKKS